MEKVKVTYLGKSYMYPKDITLEDISKDFQENYSETIIMAEVNGRPYELNYKVTDDVTVDFFDLTSPTGNRVYESGLIFVLEKACLNMLNSEIEVKYSIDKGIYIKTYKKITKEDLDKVSREMKEIVKRDLPIQKNLVNRLEAIEYYKSTKSYDKVNVLKYSVNTNVNLYRLMDIYNYFFSYLPVSTGALKEFKLTYIDQNSFVLRYPNIYYLNKIPVYKHHDKLFNEFKKYDEWSEKLGIENVSSLNSRVTKGNVDDIVLLSENIQNNSLFRIAETIYNNKKLKLILLAVPSSSGKTTTSKKLELFLKGFGLNPIAISIDNYFVDRDKTPRLPDGSYDFESLNSINVELFNKNLKYNEEEAKKKSVSEISSTLHSLYYSDPDNYYDLMLPIIKEYYKNMLFKSKYYKVDNTNDELLNKIEKWDLEYLMAEIGENFTFQEILILELYDSIYNYTDTFKSEANSNYINNCKPKIKQKLKNVGGTSTYEF